MIVKVIKVETTIHQAGETTVSASKSTDGSKEFEYDGMKFIFPDVQKLSEFQKAITSAIDYLMRP